MTPCVTIGLENLTHGFQSTLKGRRLGLLANPASVDSHFSHAVRILADLFPGRLTTLFSPQHGFYAEKQDNMIESPHGREPELGIPIYSLYSQTRIPTIQMFENIDTLVVDIQDVGTRVYTFIYTVSYCMEVAAKTGKSVVVLDRPNPIGGTRVEGNVLKPESASFVGRYPIPMRHGMTVGEICRFFNRECRIGCDLTVVPMSGWQRGMYWADTGRTWIPPSPNLPTPWSCMVYPGQVIFEGTNISEGRGTTLPFELFGAPFVNTAVMAPILNREISGACFRPVCFQPTSGKWQDQPCKGFHIHVTDRNRFEPYTASLLALQLIIKHHPDAFAFKTPPYEYEYDRLPVDLILGDPSVRTDLCALTDIKTIRARWQNELDTFKTVSRDYLLYE
ncbi:MAG: exo-beta-N-acetylmuramidase NamZ domain-containing protein [Desulfotignum sp.]